MTDADATPASRHERLSDESANVGADASPVRARHIMLVHGAYADGSSWADVIPILQAAGLEVTSVQNPLTSLDDDVAATRRALDLHDGPTVLVGHSWAGTVISQAAATQGLGAGLRRGTSARNRGGLRRTGREVPDAAGERRHHPCPAASRSSSERAFLEDFAGGMDPVRRTRAVRRAGRIADTLFASRTTVAAWRGEAVLVRGVEAGRRPPPTSSDSSRSAWARRPSRSTAATWRS